LHDQKWSNYLSHSKLEEVGLGGGGKLFMAGKTLFAKGSYGLFEGIDVGQECRGGGEPFLTESRSSTFEQRVMGLALKSFLQWGRFFTVLVVVVR